MSIDSPKPPSPRLPIASIDPTRALNTPDTGLVASNKSQPAKDPVNQLLRLVEQRNPPQIAVTIKAIETFRSNSGEVIAELVKNPTLLARAIIAGKEFNLATRELPPSNQAVLLVIQNGKLNLIAQQSERSHSVRPAPLQQLQNLLQHSQRPLAQTISNILINNSPGAATSAPASPSGSGGLPPSLPASLTQALSQLNSALPNPQQLFSAQGVKQGLLNSGIHLEGKLAQLAATQPPAAGTALQTQGDLKSLLLSALGTITPASADASKAQPSILQLLQQLTSALPAGKTASGYSIDKPLMHLFPQPPGNNPVTNVRNEQSSSQQLLLQLASAVARIQTQQLLSVTPQATSGAEANSPINNWLYELPIRHNNQLDSIQLLIEQYEHPDKEKRQNGKTYRWQINLAFEIAPLEPFQALLTLIDNRVDITLWADAQNTLQLLNKNVPELRDGLQRCGLQVEQLQCKRGLPPRKETRLDQALVDIHT